MTRMTCVGFLALGVMVGCGSSSSSAGGGGDGGSGSGANGSGANGSGANGSGANGSGAAGPVGPGPGGNGGTGGGTGGGEVADATCTVPTDQTGACVTLDAALTCNPITNAPCAAGETCDFDQDGGTQCFPPPNDQAICEPCDNANGPYCSAGLACLGVCARYCCDDADCGAGLCDKTAALPSGIGHCIGGN